MTFFMRKAAVADMFITPKMDIRRVFINLIRMEIAMYKRAMAEPWTY